MAQLTDQLLTVQMTSRTGFDDRLEKEIHRIRCAATTQDIYDR